MNYSVTEAFSRLYEIIVTLRSEFGCPWDKEQTPDSLKGSLIEELYEVIDAVESNDAPHVKEELGDLLFNVLLLCYIYEQQGAFQVRDVFLDISEKLIRRHPHVFSSNNQTAHDIDVKTVLNQWENIKNKVEGRESSSSVLDQVPKGFPPLIRAYKLQKKAAKNGYQFQDAVTCADSLISDLNDHLKRTTDEAEDKELLFGRLLFQAVSLCRLSGINPSVALHKANEEFYDTFNSK